MVSTSVVGVSAARYLVAYVHVPLSMLIPAWQETARRHDFGPDKVKALLMRQEPRRDVAGRLDEAVRTALAREPKNARELLRFAAEESVGKGLPSSSGTACGSTFAMNPKSARP